MCREEPDNSGQRFSKAHSCNVLLLLRVKVKKHMKKTVRPALLLCVVLSIFCSKTKDEAGNGIVGIWKLTEYLADPGDGSGTWQKARAINYVTFRTDSTFVGDVYPEVRRYSILSDSTIRFIRNDSLSQLYFYTLYKSNLTIRGGCFEACGSKFKRKR